MKRINYFSGCFLSKGLALFVCAMVFFNSISFMPAGKINVSGIFDIQKGVFCAVLFVSETISEVSRTFSDRIVGKGESSKKNAEKQKDDKFFVKQDFVLIKSAQQNKKSGQNANIAFHPAKEIREKASISNLASVVLQVDRGILSIFLILMIFYISSKRPKDGAAYNYFKYTGA